MSFDPCDPGSGSPTRFSSSKTAAAKEKKKPFRQVLSAVGPGIIAGAADDDPSGIATYSIAGARLGTLMLWTALLTWPLMAAVQMMCARIGMVTGEGLSTALQKKFPRWLIIMASLALFAANTINIGADLAGMADAGEMLTGINTRWSIILFGMAIGWATIRFRYQQIATMLKWLCLVLFAYAATAFIVVRDWRPLIHDTVIPKMPRGHEAWSMLVAILGTTISPYLFYWQASQEVEEEKDRGLKTVSQRKGATEGDLFVRRTDVAIGTFFSNLIMFFIIVTTAVTLHQHGINSVETSRQAAEALKPLAGAHAYAFYTMGIIGVGLLAIPVLSGSAAYALAECFGWKQGLDEKFSRARLFYWTIILSTAVGVGLNFLNINPIKALYWTAVINGLLAPVILVGIVLVASDRSLMGGQPSSFLSRLTVWGTAILITAAAVAMFLP
jgi:NRAMP (natural resistance-associated macrophage protein)-like metal ion transporter